MMITHIKNINYGLYNQYKNQNFNHQQKYIDETNFTGLGSKLETLSPLNYYMRKTMSKFIYLSKNRRFGIDKELADSLKIVHLKTPKNISEAWDINPNNSQKYVIFYHGIGQNITSNQELYKSIIKKGYGVFAPEYGGFGDSTGSVTSESIKQNTKSAIKYLQSKGIKKDDIGVVGYSLGSFPAITLAHKNENLKFLVLISPFNSMKNEKEILLSGKAVKLPKTAQFLIKKFPFLVDVLDWSFQNINKIKSLNLPVYFIHAENDKLISTKSTQELVKNTKNLKDFVILKNGGHSIDSYKINAFDNLNGI